MVTNPLRENNKFIDGKWITEAADHNKAIEKYNNSKKRFLFYPWGVFCTAYSRAALWSGILALGDDYIYSDTDSLKCLHAENHLDYIEQYNKQIVVKMKLMCDHYGVDYDMLAPKTIKGVSKMLGVWDWETKTDKYRYFKSIGSKRYMICNNDGLSITVSGVNKFKAVPYLIDKYGIDGAFDNFTIGLQIPPDYTGKLLHYYIDEPRYGTIIDYQGNEFDFEAHSGIYLEKAGYDFDISDEYLDYLNTLKEG